MMFKKTLIAAALAVAATGSFAQVYVQGAIGQGTVNAEYLGIGATSTKKSSTGNKLVVGYDLGNQWSVEANMIDYGKSSTSVTGSSAADFKVSGYGLGGAYTFDNKNSNWNFRLGLSINDNKVTTIISGLSANESSTQANVDVGVGYKLTDTFSLIGAIDSSAAKYTGKNYSTSLLSFGLRAKF
jgi:OmpA-OmpF porin, OOP family